MGRPREREPIMMTVLEKAVLDAKVKHLQSLMGKRIEGKRFEGCWNSKKRRIIF